MTDGLPLFHVADGISAPSLWTRGLFLLVAALHRRTSDPIGSQLPGGRRLACPSSQSEPSSTGREGSTWEIPVYMGHRSIQNTVSYTQLSAERFKDFWAE